ncbi:leucine-rich repeat protein [Facklamia sp. P12932]|uniref:leucine-rich repeat protein n=1 Tax=Facklamia sp. P12932 TaxID=3421947 RepID=UPI003D16997C
MKTMNKKLKIGLLAFVIAFTTIASSIVAGAKTEEWNKDDFLYSNDTTIIALSDKGIEKSKKNKELKFPEGTRVIRGNYSISNSADNKRFEREFGRGKHWSKVIIPDSVERLGYATFYTGKIDEVVLSKNLKVIGGLSFFMNELKEVILPDGLEVIEHNAFERNKLSEIVIPKSVREIEQYAFVNNRLHTIKILGNPEMSKVGIFSKQNALYKPKQNPFYQDHFGLNGKINFEKLAEGLRFKDGEYSFIGDEVDEVKMAFNLDGTSYKGEMTIVNPKKYPIGIQVKPDVKDKEIQTEPKESKDQASQTKVDVKIRYLFEDKSIYKEEVIQADIGAILDGGDLPMISDDMEFMDGFLLYEVKGDGKDLIERTVTYLKKDQETQTEEDKKDASSQTDLTMKDLEEMTKTSEEYKKKIERLEKDLASTKDSDLEKGKEIKDLKDNLDKLKKELDEKNKQLDKEKDKDLVNKIKDLDNRLEDLNKKLEDLGNKEDEKLKSESKDLEKKLEELEKSLKSKEEVNQIQNKTISNLDKEIKDLKAKLNLKTNEELKNKENSQLTSLIKEMEGKINELKNTSNNQASLSSSPLQASSQVKASPITEHTTSSKDSNQKPEVSGTNDSSNESKNNEVKDVRYPNKSTAKAPVNPVETSDGKAVNTNKGVASAPSKARATVEENVDNANNEYPIHRGDSEGLDYSADARQFVTFTTKNGKSFHLIINHDEESENVMLLTEVSKDDLLNMVESKKEEEKEDIPVKEEVVEKVEEEPVKEEKKSSAGTYFLLLLVVGGVIGAGYYFKVIKGKEASELEGFEEDYEEDYFDEAEADDEEDEDDELIEDEEEIDTEDLL